VPSRTAFDLALELWYGPLDMSQLKLPDLLAFAWLGGLALVALRFGQFLQRLR